MPRAGLTPDKVIAEAARVADEVGLDRLTLAAVAERFGVRVPSLYKHVDGLDGVRHGVAVLTVRELGEALGRAAVGRAGADALTALAAAYRAYAHAHPGRYAATLRAPDPADAELVDASAAVLDVVFAVLAGYGLVGEDAVDATRILRASLHGFVSLEMGGGFGMSRDPDVSFRRLVEGLDAAFQRWATTMPA
ncbi:MAG: TetR/AcrR family transcriptional regulator [Gemmatimonadota bacterium]|jgi:AcrR family transcriptional regulator